VFNGYVDIMNSAISKWDSIISGIKDSQQLPDHQLVLDVSIKSLGSGVLGGAGVYEYNTVSNEYGNTYPSKATIELSSSMIQSLSQEIREDGKSSLYYVFLHEVGHALGMGSLWGINISNKPIVLDDHGEKYYTSENVLREYKNVKAFEGISDQLIGIPLENEGGQGTAHVHVEEGNEGSISFDSRNLTVNGVTYYAPGLDQELMTGWAETSDVSMPLSRITVAMLEDIGYIVDYNNAEPFEGPVTPSVPKTQIITISRQASIEEKQFILSYNSLINNHTTSPITASAIHHYVYGTPHYNVTGNIEIVDNGSLLPLSIDQTIVNNGKDLLLQYTLPSDSNVTRETFYYTVFYETPNNVIIQSNNCFVTINIIA
jgi:hypothetical protein